MFEVTPTQRLEEAAYTRAANALVYERMRHKAELALAAGFGVVADAVHASLEERQGIERIASDLSCDFAGFWLEAPLDLRVDRVQNRTGDASDADAAYLRRQTDVERGSLAWDRVDASRTAASVVGEMMLKLDARP